MHVSLKSLQNIWHLLTSELLSEIISLLTPVWTSIKSEGFPAALQLAMEFMAGVAAGTPWAIITANFTAHAAEKGITLAEHEVQIVLNLADSQLKAKAATAANTAEKSAV